MTVIFSSRAWVLWEYCHILIVKSKCHFLGWNCPNLGNRIKTTQLGSYYLLVRMGFDNNVSLFVYQCYWKKVLFTFIDEIGYLLKKLGWLLDKILDENGLANTGGGLWKRKIVVRGTYNSGPNVPSCVVFFTRLNMEVIQILNCCWPTALSILISCSLSCIY